MPRPRRVSLVDFQRPPIDAASTARIGFARERMERTVQSRVQERARLAREREEAEILRLQQDEEALRRTRGDTDLWLLELADLGFIPDPDEIDAEFGSLFRDMVYRGAAGSEERATVERPEAEPDPVGARTLEFEFEDLPEKNPEARQLLQMASEELSPQIVVSSETDRLASGSGTERSGDSSGRNLILHDQTAIPWWLAAAGRALWEVLKRGPRRRGDRKDREDRTEQGSQPKVGPRKPEAPDDIEDPERTLDPLEENERRPPLELDLDALQERFGGNKELADRYVKNAARFDEFAEKHGLDPGRSIPGSEANVLTEEWLRSGGKLPLEVPFEPAHDPDGRVYETESTATFRSFIRLVEKRRANAPEGEFLMPKEEFDAIMSQPNGLERLRDEYALPVHKTHFSEVALPPGVQLQVSNAATNRFGQGGGIQVEIVSPLDDDWFSPGKELSEWK